MLLYAAQQGKKHIYIPTPELSEKIQGNASAADYYKDYKKHYTKLFGESNVQSHTDQFGNKWLKLNVPESYSEGKGVIEAYKDGGSILPKARYGPPEKEVKPIKKDPIDEDFNLFDKYDVPNMFNTFENINSYRSFNKPAPKKSIEPIEQNITLPQSIKNLLVDDRLTTGKEDQFPLLSHLFPSENMNVSDFEYKPYSEGWTALTDLKNSLEGEQWNPSKEDFFTDDEVANLFDKQLDYENKLKNFEETFPLLADDLSKDPSFTNFYLGVNIPNFRSKFLSPIQSTALTNIGLSNPTFLNRGALNLHTLKNLTKETDVLPKQYDDLLKFHKAKDYLLNTPVKEVLTLMKGLPELEGKNLELATPKQLETWRQEIVKNMENHALKKWKNESTGPLKGLDAYNQLINRTGSRNKNGGFISAKLTKKEIDQYIKGGYIIEDE